MRDLEEVSTFRKVFELLIAKAEEHEKHFSDKKQTVELFQEILVQKF